jgi:MoaF-like
LEEIGRTIIGRLFEADFGEKAFTLFYESSNKLILTEVKGSNVGSVQNLSVTIVELRPNLFMVNWQEANKLTVTDIEDYEKGVVYANMTTPNDNFITIKGILRERKEKHIQQ